MSAIPSNSTTLENIPIEDTSTLEVSSSELIIAADNTIATDVIDASSEEILSISTAIPPSMSNDTASIAEIDIDLDIGNGMSITEAPTLYNVTDAIDGFRAGRNLDFFPNILASIIKNDPVAYIERYKLSINKFADELINHQQQYGLSECLFEPLQKIGKAFEEFYGENSQKQALVKRYFEYISKLSNSSDSIPINCSDTTHWSVPTTTTPLSSIETIIPTEYVTSSVNVTLSPESTTETLQPTNSTTLRPNLNTTQNSSHDKAVPTGSLNNLFSLGGASAVHGTVAGVLHGITGSIYNYYDSRGRLNGWRKPTAQAGVMLANAIAIATLPAMLSTVENESEQSDAITKVLHATVYSLGGSLILNGINYAAHKAYYYFNKKPMGKDSIVSKALDALPLAANTGLLINGGYYLTEATVILGPNLLTAGLSSQVTQSVISRIVNKTGKNKENDVETGSNNNIPLNNLNTNAVETNAFEEDDNLDSRFQTLAIEAFNAKDTSSLDEFLTRLDQIEYFQVEKICTRDLVETSEKALQEAKVKAETIDKDLKLVEDESIKQALQKTKEQIETLLSSKTFSKEDKKSLSGANKQAAKALEYFAVLKTEKEESDATEVKIKVARQTLTDINGSKNSQQNIKIHTEMLQHQAAKKAKKVVLEVTTEALNESINAIEKALKAANVSVNPVLGSFLERAKNPQSGNITALSAASSAVNSAKSKAEKNEKDAKDAKDKDEKMSKIQAFFLKNLMLIARQNPEIAVQAYDHLLMQQRLLPTKENFATACSLVPFTTTETKSCERQADSKSMLDINSIILKKLLGSFISGLELNIKDFKFESNIFKTPGNNYSFERINIKYGTNQFLSIFTPDASKKDPANSEPLFSAINKLIENLSKIKSNDTDMYFNFLFLLSSESSNAVIEIVTYPRAAKQKGKISVYNPDNLLKNELKKLTNNAKKYGYIASFNPKINSTHLEFKQHNPFSAYYFIKNSVKDYLKDCVLPSNTPTLIETTPLVTNQPGLHQAVANEIQINLGLANCHNNLLASSMLEVLTWNGVKFDHWPKLFSSKEITLSDSETGNVYYLVKFPSNSMFETDRVAVLAKQADNEHPLLSDIRNFLVYEIPNSSNKIVKKALRINDLRELFSKFSTIQEINQETQVYSANRSSFFSAAPSSTIVAPGPQNHLAPGYK